MNDNSPSKVLIDYPCRWEYRLIGIHPENIIKAIEHVVGSREKSITFSNRSKSGKYTSLTLELEIEDEKTRNALHEALKNHPAITLVL